LRGRDRWHPYGFLGPRHHVVLIRGDLVPGSWLTGTRFENPGRWFAFYANNPYSAATFGTIVSMLTTVIATSLLKRAEWSPE
jgi:hypothetical protein